VITTERLVHARAELALHCLREGEGRPLLLLHGLGERTPDHVPAHLERWSGPCFGLDFTGHGGSTVPVGGGYTAEVLMADVDTALRRLGPATVHGRGLGAYIALLVAGARADLVCGAVLADGPGLVGGGIRPGSPYVVTTAAAERTSPPDPYALAELSRDVRPPDYAMTYVRHAVEYGELDTPIAVCTVVRPEWIEGIVGEPGVVECTVAEALDLYAT
jgi:pimeloyl-ACP methyl ester carboxylesterase